MNNTLHDEFNQDTFNLAEFNNTSSNRKNLYSPEKYWQSMGLLNSQLAFERRPTMDDENDIINDIKETNIRFFNTKKTPSIPIISIDGTCCTGKSTLCSRHNSIKTNKFMSSVGMNSHPASAISYYYNSLKLMTDFVKNNTKYNDKLNLSDRTPWNNFLWSLIWKMIVIMKDEHQIFIKQVKDNTNAYCILKQIDFPSVYTDTVLNLWKVIMESIHEVCWVSFTKTTIPIFIVNGNELLIRERMKVRAEGSDVIRSDWDFYIAVQNYAYAFLAAQYPEDICIIDTNRYADCFSQETIMDAIHELLKKEFQNIHENEILTNFDDDDTNMLVVCDKLSVDGTSYERKRCHEMDKFYSDLKHGYGEYRKQMADNINKGKKKRIE